MIQIKRNTETITSVNPLSSSNMTKAVMGEEQITLVWEAPAFVALHLGDYITYEGARWTLNQLPTVKKLSSRLFQYNAVFQSSKYELAKVTYMLVDNTATPPKGEFPLTATATEFMQLLISNLNRVYGAGTWIVGDIVSSADYKELTFSNEDCLSVLARLADEFDTEYQVINTTVHLKRRSPERQVTLQYGSTLYDIERTAVSADVVTRLYPFGGTRNIAANYRGGSSRLMLPGTDTYIENNVSLYGIVEASKNFDDIYPRLSLLGAGVVTAVGDEFTFTDTALNFDINACLIDGTPAKVHFNSGECAGYDFEIKSYNAASKTFVIIANTSEKDFTLPTSSLKPAVGDKYVLLDIIMPDAYRLAAEQELLSKATEYLAQNSTPKVAYRTTFSAIYAKQNLQNVECGDTVTVVDQDMAINEPIRVVKLQKGIGEYWNVQFDLSNTVTKTTLQRVAGDIATLQNDVVVSSERINRNNLRAYKNTRELREMVFDPDGYFDPTNIKPLSIETYMLSVGSRSQSLQLSCLLQPNYNGNAQMLYWSSGLLTHFTLVENAISEWQISQGSITITGDNQTKALYIYARCSRTGNTGDIYLSTAAMKFDSDATYWFFLIGVLHSPVGSVRGISLTYGMTTINGEFIKTGEISSIDGATFFNLNTGEIGGDIKFKTGSTYKSVANGLSDVQTAAALDATNKVDAVQVGTRNLVLGSSTPKTGNICFIAYDLSSAMAQGSRSYVLRFKYTTTADNDIGISLGTNGYFDGSFELLPRLLTGGEKIYQSEVIFNKSTQTKIVIYVNAATTISEIMLVEGNKICSNHLSAPEDVDAEIEANKSYIDSIKTDLQNQIDGNITSWFYDYEPTLLNQPAIAWTSDKKDAHLGDLYYWTSKGYAYRFQKVDSVYSWTKIADTDITKALADAARAQTTADGKMQTFSMQPTPPYQIGDLWLKGANDDIFKCITARATGGFVSGDWEKAAKYTDDTAANAAQQAANTAITNAASANAALAVMSDDDKISAVEKQSLVKEWNLIKTEKPLNLTQAQNFNVAYQDYGNAYNTLETAIGTNLDNLTTVWDLGTGGGATLRTKFNTYYSTRTTMLNAIATAAKKAGTDAQTTANSAATAASNAQSTANTANAAISVMTDDNKVDAGEKSRLKKEWDIIVSEKPKNDAQADAFGANKAAYGTKYNALSTYIGANIDNLTTVWDLGAGGGATMRTKFKEYYDSRTDLLNAIATAAKAQAITAAALDATNKVDAVQVGTRNLVLGSSTPKTGNICFIAYDLSSAMAQGSRSYVLRFKYTTTADNDIGISLGTNGYFDGSYELLPRLLTGGEKIYQSEVIFNKSTQTQIVIYVNAATTISEIMLVEGNKICSNHLSAPEDVDAKISAAQQKAADLEYISKVVGDGASTEIAGGLVLGHVLGVKNAAGGVVAGLNGLGNNSPRFWAGSNYGGRDTAPFRVYEDGRVELGNEKDGYRVNVIKDKMPTLTDLKNTVLAWSDVGGSTVVTNPLYGYTTFSFGSTSGTGASSKTERTFNLLKYSKIDISAFARVEFYTTKCDYAGWAGLNRVLIVKIINTDTGATVYENTTEIHSVDEFNSTNGTFRDEFRKDTSLALYLSAGNYKMIVEGGMYFTATQTVDSYMEVRFASSISKLNCRSIPNTTVLGTNGLATISDENRYMYLSLDDDYLLRTIGALLLQSPNLANKLELTDSGLKISGATDIPAGLGGASINSSGTVLANWGKITSTGNVVKSGSNYTITHNIGDTNYSIILTPISTNVPYFSSKAANTIVVTCAGGFDFVLIRTK